MPLTRPTLEDLRREFGTIVAPFEVHAAYKRFATSPTDDGGPHVEQVGPTYAFVVTERGSELERRETADPDDILYWLVSEVTREVALKHELHNRKPDVDSRRMWFDLDVRLLSEIRRDWGKRKRAEYDRVLEHHPFQDGA
jgi:hypothetical protein